jgi:TP53 regulating kinase and related kinases
MEKNIISQGAEAKIFLNQKGNIVKDRIKKSYRIPEIENKITKSRTKKETKLLEKALKIINVPKVFSDIKNQGRMIHMENIKGKKLSENLDKFSLNQQIKIINQIAKNISKLHEKDIIHGDLTTSNMILKNEKIYFIDFGLGYISRKYEDRAVDIHLFKQALEAKHPKNYETLLKEFLKSYNTSEESKKVLERLKAVEKRGRYKKK